MKIINKSVVLEALKAGLFAAGSVIVRGIMKI